MTQKNLAKSFNFCVFGDEEMGVEMGEKMDEKMSEERDKRRHNLRHCRDET